MSRRPKLTLPLPGPKAQEIIARSEGAVSTSYTRDYPLVAARGEGCWILDPDGNEFLDCTAGIAVTSTGHCHPEVVAAIQEQAGKLLHMSGTDFYYPPQSMLASRLTRVCAVRGEQVRVYFGNSGAEANEAALKLARYHTGRKQFIAFYGSFHGRTMGALSLGASRSRQKMRFAPFVPGVHHVGYPDPLRGGSTERTLAEIQRIFDHVAAPEEFAGIFVEPVQGEGGYTLPPDDFLPALRALCDQHGILLIYDEVQSGFGRTGHLFAWHATPQAAPDILTSAKGIASGMPLSATFASADIMSWLPGTHASTFGGNPVSCAAALKTLDLLQGGLVQNAAEVGATLQAQLQDRVGAHPRVAQVRGRGLMIGVELVQDRQTLARDPELRDAVVQEAFRRGLLILGCGPNTVRFCPALVLSREEAEVAAELFADTLNACA